MVGPLLCVLLLCSLINSLSLSRWTFSSPPLAQYASQIRTVVYVIDSIQAGNTSSSCRDASLVSGLDSLGYDGEFAQRLLCESAIGIQIFSNLAQASADMDHALEGLNSLQSDAAPSSRAAICQSLQPNAFDEVGLDGVGIWNAICGTTSPDSSTIPETTASATIGPMSSMTSLPTISHSPFDSSSTNLETASSLLTSESATTSAKASAITSISAGPTADVSSLLTPPTSEPTVSSKLSTQLNSSGTNPSSTSITVVTTVETTWLLGSPLSFPIPSSIGATDETTTTHIITSTSLLDVRTTVTVDDPISAPTGSMGGRLHEVRPMTTPGESHHHYHFNPDHSFVSGRVWPSNSTSKTRSTGFATSQFVSTIAPGNSGATKTDCTHG